MEPFWIYLQIYPLRDPVGSPHERRFRTGKNWRFRWVCPEKIWYWMICWDRTLSESNSNNFPLSFNSNGTSTPHSFSWISRMTRGTLCVCPQSAGSHLPEHQHHACAENQWERRRIIHEEVGYPTTTRIRQQDTALNLLLCTPSWRFYLLTYSKLRRWFPFCLFDFCTLQNSNTISGWWTNNRCALWLFS